MRLATGLSMALVLGFGSCALTQESFPVFYRGQVVDVDTGRPLPGVLVVFLWERDVYSPATSKVTREFHAATEVLTDKNGRFQISAAPEASVGPFLVEIRTTDPIFFAPGYFLPYKAKSEGEPFRDRTVVYMQRAENPREALEPLPLSSSFPFSHTPLLLKALNQERARLGLPPIQPGK